MIDIQAGARKCRMWAASLLRRGSFLGHRWRCRQPIFANRGRTFSHLGDDLRILCHRPSGSAAAQQKYAMDDRRMQGAATASPQY